MEFLECGKLIDAYKHKQVHVCGKKPHMCRFLIDMPSGWVFITSAILMRLAEGAGWAMYQTSAFTLLAQLFPNRVATATVCEHSLTFVYIYIYIYIYIYFCSSIIYDIIFVHTGFFRSCLLYGIWSGSSHWRASLWCSLI